MRVMLTDPPGSLFVDGVLKGVIKSEEDGGFPNMVLEMSVSGRSDPVEITLNELDLSTIMRHARASKVERLRDAVRWPYPLRRG
jgi:hypothetical protein